jgi:hypothetical protein
MNAPPIIPPPGRKAQSRFTDAILWSVCAVGIVIIGFWYPLWCDRNNGEEADSRMGFFLLGSLPFIMIFSSIATGRLIGAYQSASGRGQVSLLLVLAALCWSPLILLGVGLLRVIVEESFLWK